MTKGIPEEMPYFLDNIKRNLFVSSAKIEKKFNPQIPPGAARDRQKCLCVVLAYQQGGKEY